MNPIAKLLSFLIALALTTFQAIAQDFPGLPVDTKKVIANHPSLQVPSTVEDVLLPAVTAGFIEGVADDGTLQGGFLDGTRYLVPAIYTFSWKYSLKQVDGHAVLWIDISWNTLSLADSANAVIDYIDLGWSDVQLVDAFLDGKIDAKLFDAIAYAAQIRRNDPHRREYLLNLLANRSTTRGIATPRLVNASNHTYMLTFTQTVYNVVYSDGAWWVTGTAQMVINLIIPGYVPVGGAGKRMEN